MEIRLQGSIAIPSLLADQSVLEYKTIDIIAGNDERIHFLLAQAIPPREQGMFVPTRSNTRYQALSLSVNWQSGEITDAQLTDFGRLVPNLHFIQRLGDGFLLLGSRAQYHKDGTADQNALMTDSSGAVTSQHCFGDGIQQCLVDSQNRIITSYFDEGVFGNYGWDNPVGSCGLIAWSDDGKQVWRNEKHDICDCYAMNLSCGDHLWFYYYTDFHLVKTDYRSDLVYDPDISGASGFLIHRNEQRLMFDAGYKQHGTFIVKNVLRSTLSKGEAAHFTYGGKVVQPHGFSFRYSKAILWDAQDILYYMDWSE